MTKYRTVFRTFLLSALVTCTGFRDAPAAAPTAYHITDLGTLDGTLSAGRGINANGQVTGHSNTTGFAIHAFLYDGTMHDLGTLGGTLSDGLGINDSGHVTGQSYTTGDAELHAFLYDGTMHDLGTLGGTRSIGWGINDSGQVAGWSYTAAGPQTSGAQHAFLYDGTMHDLGTLGGTYSAGFGINDNGQVTGSSYLTGNAAGHAFLWTPTTPGGTSGTMIDLGTLGGTISEGWGINASGHVTGRSSTIGVGVTHAFLYDGTMHDLGTLGGAESHGYGINASGQVVGDAHTTEGERRPFLHTSDLGMVDLNSLIDPLAGWDLRDARGINDAGQITGYGFHGGQPRAFLLTPVPEPASLALLALGLPLLVGRNVRRFGNGGTCGAYGPMTVSVVPNWRRNTNQH